MSTLLIGNSERIFAVSIIVFTWYSLYYVVVIMFTFQKIILHYSRFSALLEAKWLGN